MKLILGLAIAVLGFSQARATEVQKLNFGYYNRYAYYSCDYARNRVQQHLAKLGATNIHTTCTGGIEPYRPWFPINLTATFEQKESVGNVVTLRGNDSCDFNVRLIDAILKTVAHKNVSKQSNCWDSRGSYTYQVQLN